MKAALLKSSVIACASTLMIGCKQFSKPETSAVKTDDTNPNQQFEIAKCENPRGVQYAGNMPQKVSFVVRDSTQRFQWHAQEPDTRPLFVIFKENYKEQIDVTDTNVSVQVLPNAQTDESTNMLTLNRGDSPQKLTAIVMNGTRRSTEPARADGTVRVSWKPSSSASGDENVIEYQCVFSNLGLLKISGGAPISQNEICGTLVSKNNQFVLDFGEMDSPRPLEASDGASLNALNEAVGKIVCIDSQNTSGVIIVSRGGFRVR